MALLAESLVDEWLNRQGFFTVRGIKHGVEEIDLLGVRPVQGNLEGWHVEVQSSFRPMGYICPLLSEHIPSFAKSKRSAKRRPEPMIRQCREAWVNGKFLSETKAKARNSAWSALDWRFVFVHAEVLENKELQVIAECGIKVIPLYEVLKELGHNPGELRGGAGTDLAEIIEYFSNNIS